MNIYKFVDEVYNNKAFVLAKDENEAVSVLKTKTSISFKLVDFKNPNELKNPVVIINNILPF